jgi:hypothetical protein
VPEEYVAQGHCFSLGEHERELIYSFDVCSGCEAHSIVQQLEQNRQRPGRASDSAELSQWIEEKAQETLPHLDWWQSGGRAVASERGFIKDFLHCPS